MYEYKIDDGEEFTLDKNYETKEDFVKAIYSIKKKIVYEIEFKDDDFVEIEASGEIDLKNFKLTKKKVKEKSYTNADLDNATDFFRNIFKMKGA
jgi:hypothetical protein